MTMAAALAFGLAAVAATSTGGCSGDGDAPGGSSGVTSGVGGGGGGDAPLPPLVPAPAGMRRLTARQYVNSVRVMFGAAVAAAATPPDDIPLHGFSSIGAAEIAIPEAAIETYESSARAVGEALVADSNALSLVFDATCAAAPGPERRACFAAFVAGVGKVAWRRPLTTAEVDRVVDIAIDAVTEYGDVNRGVVYAVMALLVAPDFLYLVEVGASDPDDASQRRLTPHELVTRVSYFLTDSPATAAQLDAAAAGAYDDEAGLREFARELLAVPEAPAALASFFAELYRLEQLARVAKDETLFPEWSPEVAAGLYDATQFMLADIVWSRDADAREIFSADYAFVNETTAPLYGVSVDTVAYQKITMPSTQARRGLMGQPAMMSLLSAANGTSPTRRGVFVRRVLMCDTIPPPDPDAELELPEPDPDNPMSKKELLQLHFESPGCAGCHRLFDPVGLAFESFDAIGRHRTLDDYGLPVDTSGDQSGLGAFETPGDVGALLADDVGVADCLVTNIFRHSMGHLETEGEEGALIELSRDFAREGYSFQSLMVALVAHPAFRRVGDPK
ncbi:MAG: DUF1588 domain-containing protein [Myxococcota bacterium]